MAASNDEYEKNSAAFRRLKDTIDRTYPKGWFVGIANGQIVAAAGSLPELETLLREKGFDPRRSLAAEAGAFHPDYATIFLS